MHTLISSAKRFVRDEDGITMVEYAIMAAMIAAFLILAIPTLTGAVTTAFGKVVTAVNGA